ncbi:Two-component system response regulator [Paramagnetospirillum magnetotacticum MS-1]|uniref:Two-component system response regulator n=1 Tax=Paramagnetospirillum magnetotacticum MS-1 TaxID=272627 RepID=A0A0C2UES1_PARME|nr:response regulator [Paramagnetospirillum magnetotacticum]KIL99997.1 Two-component system response regulator [Paramagnetospirillum magnetotacticum MS-1]
MASKEIHDILLVEDDLGDAGLVRIALRRSRHVCRLHHVKDGGEAMEFLRQGKGHAQAPRPDLILLDLNLPGRNGHEILEDIRADTALCSIPVVMLSTSGAERDVRKAYALGASSYVSKPMDVEAFTAAIHSIEDFWFGTAQLPP